VDEFIPRCIGQHPEELLSDYSQRYIFLEQILQRCTFYELFPSYVKHP